MQTFLESCYFRSTVGCDIVVKVLFVGPVPTCFLSLTWFVATAAEKRAGRVGFFGVVVIPTIEGRKNTCYCRVMSVIEDKEPGT